MRDAAGLFFLPIILFPYVAPSTKKELTTKALSTRDDVTVSTKNVMEKTYIKSDLLPTVSNMTSGNTTTKLKPTATAVSDVVSILTTLTKIVCIIVLVSGILGNSLVLVIFGFRCGRLKTFEIYMVNLAIADLIGTIVFPSIQLHTLLGGSFHYIGKAGCKTIYFLTTLSITESALTLIIISVDRYLIVTRPFRERVSKLSISLFIALTWGVSSIMGLSHFIGDRIILSKDNKGGPVVCRVTYKTPQDELEGTIYIIIIFAAQNGIPLIALLVLYSLIIIKLRQTQDQVYNLQCLRNTKTITLLIVIVVLFFVCVTPSNIFYMLYHFNAIPMSADYVYPLYAFLTMLLMMNSCINPLIYARLHSWFRRTVKRVFCYCCNYTQDSYHARGLTTLTATFRYESDTSDDSRISLREITHQTPRERNSCGDVSTEAVFGANSDLIDDTS